MPQFTAIADLLANHYLPPHETKEGFCRIANVSVTLSEQVWAAARLQVVGFKLVLDRSGIRHTLKQHGVGNAASELAQGQVPITDTDFLALPNWLAAPELVQAGQPRPRQQPLPCVEFYAQGPTGRVCAVLEYRHGRKCLAVVTMYKKRPTT